LGLEASCSKNLGGEYLTFSRKTGGGGEGETLRAKQEDERDFKESPLTRPPSLRPVAKYVTRKGGQGFGSKEGTKEKEGRSEVPYPLYSLQKEKDRLKKLRKG